DFGGSEARHSALATILDEARARDAFTLWHLLRRVEAGDRPRVYARLEALVPAPKGVTREGVLQLDSAMLDAWWNAFDLGDISTWRFWEQSERPGAAHPSAAERLQKKQALVKPSR